MDNTDDEQEEENIEFRIRSPLAGLHEISRRPNWNMATHILLHGFAFLDRTEEQAFLACHSLLHLECNLRLMPGVHHCEVWLPPSLRSARITRPTRVMLVLDENHVRRRTATLALEEFRVTSKEGN